MAKKLSIGVLVIMFAFMFSACSNNYVYKESDFSLEISVDKTSVSVGETVKINATFNNLSVKNIRIQMHHTDFKTLESMILIRVFQEDTENNFSFNMKGGQGANI